MPNRSGKTIHMNHAHSNVIACQIGPICCSLVVCSPITHTRVTWPRIRCVCVVVALFDGTCRKNWVAGLENGLGLHI